MSIFSRCGKDIEDYRTTTCFNDHIEFRNGAVLPRVPHSGEGRYPVCNVVPGTVHHKDCYTERCAKGESRDVAKKSSR